MVYLQLLNITADLQEAVNGLYEPLIVMVTHPLNLFVVRLDTCVQMMKEFLRLRSFIHRPSRTIQHDNEYLL